MREMLRTNALMWYNKKSPGAAGTARAWPVPVVEVTDDMILPFPPNSEIDSRSRTCRTCGHSYSENADYFYRNKKSRGGLSAQCKRCDDEARARRRAQNPNRERELRDSRLARYQANPQSSESKLCRSCGHIKPLEAFNKNTHSPDGRRSQCRNCQSAYTRSYEQSHREESRLKKLQWNRNNPDRVRRYGENYRASYPERIREARRRERLRNPEKFRLRSRLRYQSRRARQHDNGGVLTPSQWEAIKKQYDYRCLACGRREPDIQITIDHVMPISLGGSFGPENVQPLCFSCNCRKNAKHIDYR